MKNMHPLNSNQFFTFEDQILKEWFSKFSYPWDALKNIKALLDVLPKGQNLGNTSPLAFIENPEQVYISPNVIIEPFVFIQGPCFIGESSIIRHGAYIRSCVFIGKNCVVGHSSEIKNAFLFDGAHAAHFNYVGDSILGHRVNLGAGVKCANLRLDDKNINVRSEGCRFNTGMRKLGAIIGDDAQIGCNAVLNPGTAMAKNASCSPCSNIGGYIPSKISI